MSRYEIKYNEKLLKHYFYDNELKKQISFDDVLKTIETQNNQLSEKDKEIKYYHQVMIQQKEKIDHLYEVIKKNSKTIRHEICKEIKENGLYNEYYNTLIIKPQVLKQIEQGNKGE